MESETRDQLSRDIAAKALSEITAHALVCLERQKRMDERADDVEKWQTQVDIRLINLQKELQALAKQQLRFLVSIISLSLAVNGVLATYVFLHQNLH